jgi:hypothetical protein
VSVYKKNEKLRVCIDFTDGWLSNANSRYIGRCSSWHKVISFMDGNAGYNQIFMAVEDIAKTAFRCPGANGLFEWAVMTFSLKNAGATYQTAMDCIFHKLISRIVEIYIDDVVVKSKGYKEDLADLRETLECVRRHGLRINPNKCAFRVSAG